MGEVVVLPVETSLDLPAERVLQGALEKDYRHVVVLAEDREGRFHVASSKASYAYALMLVELGRKRLLEQIDGD